MAFPTRSNRSVKVRLAGIENNLSAFLAMVQKEFIIMLRYPVEFVASFAQVFVIVVVLTFAGLMFAPRGLASSTDSATTGLVVYGFVLFIYLSDTLWTIGFNVRREQKQGTLEQLYLSPVSKFAALASRVAITLFWTGLLSVCAAVLMTALLGTLPFENGGLGLFVLVMALSGTFGTGFAFAALTLRIKEAAQTAVNLLQFAFMVLCAPFFPFSALPESLRFFSRLIPLSYGVDAFRSTLMGYPPGFPELAPIEVELVIVTLFGLLMPLVGFWLYRRAEDHARRRGSLSEY
ncbi:MAG: ABC transporter permease [Chloroflexi bacterium]|nr:MAG: ABC transporter permease [Chloroflexota bacterium]